VPEERFVELIVEDNGPGVSDERHTLREVLPGRAGVDSIAPGMGSASRSPRV
jgi:hypothetical protein